MMNNLDTNLTALKLINPALSKQIGKANQPDWIDPINCLTGEKNAIISSGSHKTTIYEMENPFKIPEKLIPEVNCFKEDINVLLGLGLGYITQNAIKKMEVDWLLYIGEKRIISKELSEFLTLKNKAKSILYRGHHIVVIEPCLYLIKLAFELFDYSEYLKSGALIITTNKDEVIGYLGALETQKSIEAWMLTTYPYTNIRPEYYKLGLYATEYINQLRCNTGTVAGQGSKIADNGIVGLPYTIRHRGVKELYGLFPGKPAICVSTGPSLSRNIHLLKNIQDKVIIIAVAQALRVLLAYDIQPDFICTVDFGEVNMGHFRGLMDSAVPLVCLDRSYAPLLKQYRGPRFISATPPNPGFENTANGILKNKGTLEMGGSVAHMCFSLGVAMKCEPIIMIGQDLSYSENDSHCALADATGKIKINSEGLIEWDVQDQRCSLHGEKSYAMGRQHFIRGYFDDNVTTNMGLASFITAFENLIRQYHKVYPDKTIYNCTEGGAHIKGAERIPFQKAIDGFCKESIDKSILKPLLSLDPNGNKLIGEAIPLLKKDIAIMNKIIHYCTKGVSSNKQVESAIKYNNPYQKPLKVNEINSNKAYKESMKLPLVLISVVGANRQIQSRQLNVNGSYEHITGNKKDFKIRLERNAIILNAAKKASEDLKASYKESLSLLEKYKKNPIILDPIDENYKINLDDAEDYFKVGNWAHPLLDALKMKITNHIKNNMGDIDEDLNERNALLIQEKAFQIRDKAIQKAKNEYNNTKEKYKIIEYNNLIEESSKIGRESQNFDKAIKLIQKAINLLPDRQEARWGLATTYHHLEMFDLSLAAYEDLIKKFPDIPRFQFEYGQVLIIAEQTDKGIKEICSAMQKTKEFETFWPIIGNIYFKNKKYEDALSAYKTYLEGYPFDYEIMSSQMKCLKILNRDEEAQEILNKITKIFPQEASKIANSD